MRQCLPFAKHFGRNLFPSSDIFLAPLSPEVQNLPLTPARSCSHTYRPGLKFQIIASVATTGIIADTPQPWTSSVSGVLLRLPAAYVACAVLPTPHPTQRAQVNVRVTKASGVRGRVDMKGAPTSKSSTLRLNPCVTLTENLTSSSLVFSISSVGIIT